MAKSLFVWQIFSTISVGHLRFLHVHCYHHPNRLKWYMTHSYSFQIPNCKNASMVMSKMCPVSLLTRSFYRSGLPPLTGTRSWENILLMHCLLSLYLFQTGKKKRKGDAFKVMGKCDFQALPIHVYPRSSRRERRCCCFSCWFLPAAGKEREERGWVVGGGALGARSLRKCLDIS